MADAYVDFEQTASTATSPYETWAKAAATIQVGLTQAGAGGRVFVRIDGDGVGTTKDTNAGTRTLSFPGTDQNPAVIYGVKDATTATPPTDSDLTVRGTDTLPVYETSSGDINLDEVDANSGVLCIMHGIKIDAAGRLKLGFDTSYYISGGEVAYSSDFAIRTGCDIYLENCNLILAGAGSEINTDDGAIFTMHGGLLSGTAATILMDANPEGEAIFIGVDCSLITGTLVDFSVMSGGITRFINCKMANGVTRITGVPRTGAAFVELIGSTDETGLGSGESVRDYAKEFYKGTVLNEATFIRTGGANDGVAGFSYAMTPRTSSTKEGILALSTPWFGGVVKGDASTSKDFTIYIANSSGADMTKADVWVEILLPSAAGTTDHDFDVSSRTIIDASASDVADDTASDWSTGAGGKNAQKIVITATPDYQGPVYARVMFAQAGTNTLYVDPKIDITDT